MFNGCKPLHLNRHSDVTVYSTLDSIDDDKIGQFFCFFLYLHGKYDKSQMPCYGNHTFTAQWVIWYCKQFKYTDFTYCFVFYASCTYHTVCILQMYSGLQKPNNYYIINICLYTHILDFTICILLINLLFIIYVDQ